MAETGSAPAVRWVTIASPDPVRETVQVLENLLLIAIVALVVGGIGGRRAAGAVPLAAHQVSFRAQAPAVQRVYRELRSALADALRVRAESGRWPGVDALAADLVEPFAAAGPDGAWSWTMVAEGGLVNYVGRPAQAAPDVPGKSPEGDGSPRASWLLLIEEPPPGTDRLEHRKADALDEFHRALDDGTVVHVGFWLRDDAAPTGAKAQSTPQRDGWREVVAGDPERTLP